MYTPLYVKTEYSLLSSLISIDDLVKYLKKNNFSFCAIVDDHLYATMEVIHKFKANNINPIIGLEKKVNNKKILLYAQNLSGYYNLVKLDSLLEELTYDHLKTYASDLACVTFLENNDFTTLQDIYKDLYVGVNNFTDEALALKITDQVIFVNETLYLEEYQYKYLPYLLMIRDGKTIDTGIEFIKGAHLILDPTNLVSEKTLKNTLKFQEYTFSSFPKALYMPKYFEDDKDNTKAKDYLRSLSYKGLERRLNGHISKAYQERLDYELSIIIKMNFENYFLVVYDYILYAKKNDILVGPGRGSAAGSLVAYCLGITEVDPLKYNLLFERFLNPYRISMPDIDTDFPDNERDRVINYVKEKYGNKNVAGIVTFGTLGNKQAVRDFGRVLNIPNYQIDLVCKKLAVNDDLKKLKEEDQEIKALFQDEKMQLLYHLVLLTKNHKRHTSVHAAGIVISYKVLDEILPIILNDNMYLTGYTMEYLEELGLIKMDFLGIKNLTIIKNILNDINATREKKISFNMIPLDDTKVLSLFQNADTTGIFQFESAGMRKFLKELKPASFLEICAAIALFRPGPAAFIPNYIARKEGREKIDYIVPQLEEILKETYGIIVYQEQIMQIASIMANYTLGEADILRKAMSKKKKDVLEKEEKQFIEKACANGYSLDVSKRVYEMILSFANYGFNKSHSVCYSVVAYKMTYLKYYFPNYFYCHLLSGVIGSSVKTEEYIKEMRKKDLKINLPSINKSFDTYKVVERDIIMPFSAIRNVGEVISSYIVQERLKNGPYQDIFDFVKRTFEKTNNKKVLESLIYAQVFREFPYSCRTLIEGLDAILNYVELSMGLEDGLIAKPVLEIKEEYSKDDLLEQEKSLFGFYITSHKTSKYKLAAPTVISLNELALNFNKRKEIIMVIDKIKEITTKKNELMCFIDGSDDTGSCSVIVFPNLYKDFSSKTFAKGQVIKALGRIERRYEEYQIIADSISILSDGK